jgi:hypothetical protein
MDITYSIKGDIEVQRRLQTMGDRVRWNVQEAILGMMDNVQSMAMSRAPVGKTGRLQQGIILAFQGEGWFRPPNNGNAITDRQIERYKAFAKDKTSVVGVVLSTWFTGRFFETGINQPNTWVGPRANQAAFNAYEKSYRRSVTNYSRFKKHKDLQGRDWNAAGQYGPITQGDHDRYVARAMKASLNARRKAERGGKGFSRHQYLPKRAFMEPAGRAIATVFESTIQAAVDKAVRDGR